MGRPKALVVIPTYLTKPEDVEVTMTAVESVRKTQGDGVDVLLVDDGSPAAEQVDALAAGVEPLDAELYRKADNQGFSRTVNIGLNRALEEGRDAVLLNADMEITTPGWLRHFKVTQDDRYQPAAVVGALLMFPSGLIQHAGIYFSLLTRTFDHLYKYAPSNLPEALERRICPVTAAFQYIRHSTLEKVGVYDEQFLLGWEDVDYCIRVFLEGERCVYTPNVRGFHYEMMFRGRPSPKIQEWQAKSFMYLCMKYHDRSFAEWVPYW